MTVTYQSHGGTHFRLVWEIQREPLSGGKEAFVGRHLDYPGAVVQERTYRRAAARLRKMVRWFKSHG